MALITTTGVTVTLDETSGLQNASATPTPAGDADDNDTSLPLPAAFSTRLATLLDATTPTETLINAALSGYDGTNSGLNAFTITPAAGGAITDIRFTDSAGALLDGLDSDLTTAGGVKIFLYTDTTNNNIVLGRAAATNGSADPSGAIVFAAYIEETGSPSVTGGKIWTVLYQPLSHDTPGDGTTPPGSYDEAVNLLNKVFIGTSQDTNFSLTGAPAGQQLFLMFTTEGATADVNGRIPGVSIIVTGKNPLDQSASGDAITSADTVNSSKASGDTTLGTNNQAITEQEGLRFSFVTGAKQDFTVSDDPAVDGLAPGEAGVEANIDFTQYFGASSATFQIVQEVGGTTAKILLTAFKNADNVSGSQSGVNFINSYADDDTEKVAITNGSVTVKTFAGATVSGAVITYNADGTVLITGVPTDSQITYSTATVHNRVLIENAGLLTAKNGDKTHADFDIGGFEVLQTSVDKIEIGSNMVFEDDGPNAVLSGTPLDTLVLDETRPVGTEEDGDSAPAGLDTVTANFADNFAAVTDYGSDGAGSTGYTLALTGSNVGSGLYALDAADTSAGDGDGIGQGAQIVLNLSGNTVTGSVGGTDYFTIGINTTTGVVTFTQLSNIWHASTASDDDSATLTTSAANLLRVVQTVTDRDGDVDTAAINLGAGVFSIEDDGPNAVVFNATADTLVLDETRPVGTEEDGDSAPAGLDTVTANFADNFVAVTDYGSDGAGSTGYTLALTGSNVGSGLYALDAADTSAGDGDGIGQGAQIVLNQSGNTVTGSVGGTDYFTIGINNTTGVVTFTQLSNIWHASTASDDDSATLTTSAANLLRVVQTVTDRDGDSDSASINLGAGVFSIEDDGPAILTKTDLIIYANSSNPTPGGTGIFDYAIGADARLTFSSSNSDFSAITLTGTVGSTAISSPTVTWSFEDASTAIFTVQFNYQADPASTTTTAATGTLTFDKVNDTYTVALTQPISGFTTLTTGQALGFTGYTAGTSTIDKTQPDVSVAQLSSDFFVQFTGASEPGGGTGANNIQAVGVDAGTNFVNGELFTQAATWVSVSNTANGVAGDTIQKGEVLDLDFFNTNPTGFTSLTPTTQASGIFLKFDGIGSEDLVVVLKLVDNLGTASTADDVRTTKAIIIDNSDIIKFGGTIPAGYTIVLDHNDGAVIIESNDFNTGSQNYLIEGAQLLVSTEGVTGTAINLNAATGSSGGSTTTQEFGVATTDNDVIKISDIGFVTANSATLNTNLSFNVSVVDADGDATSTQTLDVSIVGDGSLTPTSDADTFVFSDADADGLLAMVMYNITSGFATGTDKLDFSTAGSGTNYAENTIAAANVSAFVTAADTALNGTVDYYFGVVGGNGYLATDSDGNGITSIVQLVGVTDMAFADIV